MLRFATLAMVFALAPTVLAQSLAPRVFPNPISAERAVTVEVADVEAATVEVVDVLGRVLSLDAPLAAGTYLVRVRYADGRATAPASVTVATPGRIEFRLVETLTGAVAADPVQTQPEADAGKSGLGCSPGDVQFGGFQHDANTGSLKLRPDLLPPSMRVNPPTGSSDANFDTCLGEVVGWSFRYIAGGDPGNRPMRVLSPATVGNTSATFTTMYTDGSPPAANRGGTAFVHGVFETSIDDDGSPATPDLPVVEAFAFPGVLMSQGLSYELIVLDDEAVVYRATLSAPTYLASTSEDGRINMTRSILTSIYADGYEIEEEFKQGGGGKPGDLSAVMSFESGDGGPVDVYVGSIPDLSGGGVPLVATGTSIHLTPSFSLSGGEFSMNGVNTDVTGMNRFGVRAFQFAAGSDFFSPERPTVTPRGAAARQVHLYNGQWARNTASDYLRDQTTDAVDAELPVVFVSGSAEQLGLQWGREPEPLQETGSSNIEIYHEFAFARQGAPQRGGGGGVRLDEDGEYYLATARVRNISDVQDETVGVEIANVGGSGTSVTVTALNGSFSTYTFVFNLSGGGTFVQSYNVGDTIVFGPDVIIVDASRSHYDGMVAKAGIDQLYSVGFLLSNDMGDFGELTILPDWNTTPAQVNTRDFATDTNQPFDIFGINEEDIGGMLRGGSQSRWTRGE